MQCPRCYFSNPPGTRVCEYCGARLEGTTDTQAQPASASAKRKTMLGPAPGRSTAARPLPGPAIDPEDPFRIAAQGVGDPTPPPAPAPDPKPTMAAPPPPPSLHRPTMVSIAPSASPSIGGMALILTADGRSRAVVLREGRTRIGRRPDAEVVLDDPEASGDHAILRIDGEKAWLLDTSANGTRVSGVLCMNDRAEIEDGSVLQIGQTAVIVKLLRPETRAHLVGLG